MLVDIFCEIDDFCKYFENQRRDKLLSSGAMKRVKKSTLSMSEVMTIVVYFGTVLGGDCLRSCVSIILTYPQIG